MGTQPPAVTGVVVLSQAKQLVTLTEPAADVVEGGQALHVRLASYWPAGQTTSAQVPDDVGTLLLIQLPAAGNTYIAGNSEQCIAAPSVTWGQRTDSYISYNATQVCCAVVALRRS